MDGRYFNPNYLLTVTPLEISCYMHESASVMLLSNCIQ